MPKHDCTAVSEVVGEMLMLSLVILLVAIFSASLSSYLPSDRDPTVTIKMTNTTENITFWHKGGDWVKKSDITVVVMNQSGAERFGSDRFTLVPDTQAFDLGGTITIGYSVEGGEDVRLVTPRAVIYTGRL